MNIYALPDLLRHPGWISLAAASAAYVVLSLAMLPVWPLTILLGSVYGIWVGLLIAMPSSLVGALAVFVLGQSVLRDWARRRLAGIGCRPSGERSAAETAGLRSCSGCPRSCRSM